MPGEVGPMGKRGPPGYTLKGDQGYDGPKGRMGPPGKY